MLKAYGKFWKNYVNFTGKASRADYWWVFLVHTILFVIASTIFAIIFLRHFISTPYTDDLGGVLFGFTDVTLYFLIFMFVCGVLGLAIAMPSIALQIRRFNDLGWKWQTSLLVLLALGLLNFLTFGKSFILILILNALPADIFGKQSAR
jgi:uncharacterized membrane protein YhaH (DUF805 family)